jgi:DNA repair ATPase RecN
VRQSSSIQITVLTFIVGNIQDRQIVIRNGNVGEILARFNTEEQVRAAFPDLGMQMQIIHKRKIFTKN